MNLSGSRVKISRRLGLALTPRTIEYLERKPYPPGEHGPNVRRAPKLSDYKRQLLEKQRLRAQYNISERQMRNYVRKAVRKRGNTADNLIQLLEARLDAVVYRAGFARTISAARQYVAHRHILVDGRWVNIASQQIRIGEAVAVNEKSRELPCFVEAKEEMVRATMPYLQRDPETMSVKLLYLPPREEVVAVSCEIPLVIEYYSR